MNDRDGTQSPSSQRTPDRRPNKNKKENTQTKMAAAQKATAVFLLYKEIFDNAADAVKPLGEVGIELLIVFFVHFGAVIL